MLTVVIPHYNRDLKQLVRHLPTEHERVKFVVVECGQSRKSKSLCANNGIKYIHEKTRYGEPFNTGRLLNAGIKAAETEWVMKLDADCYPYQGFFDRLLAYLESEKRPRFWFAIVGVMYLSRNWSRDILRDVFDKDVAFGVNVGHCDVLMLPFGVKFPCGNEYVVRREDILDIGGSKEFEGYGFEDYATELSLMAAREYPFWRNILDVEKTRISQAIRDKLVIPENRKSAQEGLLLLHRWHERQVKHPYAIKNMNALYEHAQALKKLK